MTIRDRWSLGLSAGVAVSLIALSSRFLGSHYPDVRAEATIGLVFAIISLVIAAAGVLWVLIRRYSPRNSA
jgi:uncharacterized YccA/Bax inhibitor family protein